MIELIYKSICIIYMTLYILQIFLDDGIRKILDKIFISLPVLLIIISFSLGSYIESFIWLIILISEHNHQKN